MTCPKCNHIVERPDIPHVVRACEGCGRLPRIRQSGEHGIGFQICKGDQVVIPASWLRLSLNPLKSRGQFSRYGLQWLAEQIHLEGLPHKKDDIGAEIDRLEKRAEEILNASRLLEGLDIAKPDHTSKIIETLKERQDSIEWSALCQAHS